MTPKQAIDYIHGTQRFGSKPGLARVEALLEKMGNPHKELKYVHVAGTNGKGSTCAMTASVLNEAGYKTGLYTSPYLESFYERMRVDGDYITSDELARYTTDIKGIIDEIVAEGGMHPTQFEIGTALAFQYFLDSKCDIVVLEVGIGGRFDATNCIPSPEVAAITSMSLDHTEYLGNTLHEVTGEKCGILKPGCTPVTGINQPTEAFARITSECNALGLTLRVPDEIALDVIGLDIRGCHFMYKGLDITVPLAGAVQVTNALTAIEILFALRELGYVIPDSAITNGMSKTVWKGRFEILREKPLCIIDGAHNIDAITQLCVSIDSLLPCGCSPHGNNEHRRRIVIMGMLRDKDYKASIAMVAQRTDFFIAVSPDSPHALTPEEIAECATPHCNHVECAVDTKSAVERAAALSGDDGVIFGCGSLYLIGGLRGAIREYSM